MESLNGEGAMEIVHTTPVRDVDPVSNIEPAENMHSNHVPGSPNTSEDSISDANVLRRPLRASASNWLYIHFPDAVREVQVSESGRRRFVLVLEDRQIITCILNYLRSIADYFASEQTHAILRSCLSLMVNVPAAYDHLEAEVHTGPVLLASLLDIVFQIREERTVERRELYLRTALDTIEDWLHPDYS